MGFLKSESVFDTIRPISCISKFFGIFPFTITKNNQNYDISTKFPDLLFVLMQLSIITFLEAMNLSSNLFVVSDTSEITNVGMHATITSALFLIFVIILVNFLFKKNIVKMLLSLHEIDHSMKNMNVEEDFCGQKRNSLLFLICDSIFAFIGLSSVTYLFLFQLETPPSAIIICSMLLLVIIYSTFFLNYLLFVHSVWARFKCMNNYLETFINKTDSNKFYLNVNKFAVIHDKLNDVVGCINFHYSVWILLSTGCCFVFTVLNVFSAIRVFFNYDYETFILSTIYIIITVLYMSRIGYVIAFGSNTTLEVRKFVKCTREDFVKCLVI